MSWHNEIYLLAAVFIAGCSSSGSLNTAEFEARRHMAIADTLEQASSLKEATLEYSLVARKYPSTSVYPTAVRKTALLLSSPSNPVANDSASQYWLSIYLGLTRSPEERQIIEMYLNMVGRVKTLRDSLTKETALSDSLAFAVRKQGNEVSSRGKRIQELEADLQKTTEELNTLKEIDVRISKSRVKSKP